eukprot:6214291-Alexandrium_andersonii.AAC.1
MRARARGAGKGPTPALSRSHRAGALGAARALRTVRTVTRRSAQARVVPVPVRGGAQLLPGRA